MSCVHTKTKCQCFQIPLWVEEIFRKAPFSWRISVTVSLTERSKRLEESFRKTPFLRRISVDSRPNRRNKAALSNSTSLKRVFEQPRFRDGLLWKVGLNVEIKLRFPVPLTLYGRALRGIFVKSYSHILQ